MMQQLIANSILAASVYALVGTGFALIYRSSHFFHFAHGLMCTAGAYLAFIFNTQLRMSLPTSFFLAVGFSTLLGCIIEASVYRPLRRKGASSIILLLASLGIYIVGQNLISMIFGDDTKTLHPRVVEQGLQILGARITTVQLSIIATCLIVIIGLVALLETTRMGKIVRAVANDPELARSCGINTDHVIMWTMAFGSCLAGLGGVLIALDVSMVPTMGMRVLLMSVTAVIIGGAQSTVGVSLGALLIAFAQHLGVWKLPTQWQDAIVFAILILFLIVRPQGFLGKPLSRATV